MSTATLTNPSIQDAADIRTVITAVHRANYDKDAAALVAPYAEAAAIFDLAPPLANTMTRERKEKWLATWNGPVEFETQDLDFTVSGDLAVGHGFYRMSGMPKSAGRRISFWMRATVCLRRHDDGWQITHEHTSVPFYMDGSLRPAFDLTPE